MMRFDICFINVKLIKINSSSLSTLLNFVRLNSKIWKHSYTQYLDSFFFQLLLRKAIAAIKKRFSFNRILKTGSFKKNGQKRNLRKRTFSFSFLLLLPTRLQVLFSVPDSAMLLKAIRPTIVILLSAQMLPIPVKSR